MVEITYLNNNLSLICIPQNSLTNATSFVEEIEHELMLCKYLLDEKFINNCASKNGFYEKQLRNSEYNTIVFNNLIKKCNCDVTTFFKIILSCYKKVETFVSNLLETLENLPNFLKLNINHNKKQKLCHNTYFIL